MMLGESAALAEVRSVFRERAIIMPPGRSIADSAWDLVRGSLEQDVGLGNVRAAVLCWNRYPINDHRRSSGPARIGVFGPKIGGGRLQEAAINAQWYRCTAALRIHRG